MRDPRGFLTAETRSWVDDGVIDQEQRASILDRYPEDDHRKRQASLMAVLGSILVGVGAILFVATNWQTIPRFLRFGVLVGATLGAHAAAYYLRDHTARSPKVGHALYLLGSLLFGATLFLVAQMYNVNANAPWLILAWLAGVAPMAWGMRSVPILVLAVGLHALWLGFQGVAWMMRSPVDVDGPGAIMLPFLAWGVLLWGLGRVHRTWGKLERVAHFDPWLRGFGCVGIAAGLYALTFDFDFGSNGQQNLAVMELAALTVAMVLVGVAGLAWWYAAKGGDRRTVDTGEVLGIATIASLGLVTYFVADPLTNAVVYNVVLAVAIIGVIFLGFHQREEWLINLGVLFFVVDVVTRYFDLFFDLMDRSLFFIVGGLILIGGGWLLERQRRVLVDRTREDDHDGGTHAEASP